MGERSLIIDFDRVRNQYIRKLTSLIFVQMDPEIDPDRFKA